MNQSLFVILEHQVKALHCTVTPDLTVCLGYVGT